MSNSDKSATTGSGITFVGLLTILFIGLKLTNHISWSWPWVLSPMWIGFALWISLVVLVFVGATILGFFRR